MLRIGRFLAILRNWGYIMRKLMALLTVLMLALGGIAALAEAESIEVPALAPTDGDMALDGLALDDVDIGEVELGDTPI